MRCGRGQQHRTSRQHRLNRLNSMRCGRGRQHRTSRQHRLDRLGPKQYELSRRRQRGRSGHGSVAHRHQASRHTHRRIAANVCALHDNDCKRRVSHANPRTTLQLHHRTQADDSTTPTTPTHRNTPQHTATHSSQARAPAQWPKPHDQAVPRQQSCCAHACTLAPSRRSLRGLRGLRNASTRLTDDSANDCGHITRRSRRCCSGTCTASCGAATAARPRPGYSGTSMGSSLAGPRV